MPRIEDVIKDLGISKQTFSRYFEKVMGKEMTAKVATVSDANLVKIKKLLEKNGKIKLEEKKEDVKIFISKKNNEPKATLKSDELGGFGFLSGLGFVNKNNKWEFDKIAGKKYEYNETIKKNEEIILKYKNDIEKRKTKRKQHYENYKNKLTDECKAIKEKLKDVEKERRNLEQKIEELEKKENSGNNDKRELEIEKDIKEQAIKKNPLDRKSRQRLNEIKEKLETIKNKKKEKSPEMENLSINLSELLYKVNRLHEEYEERETIIKDKEMLEKKANYNGYINFENEIETIKHRIYIIEEENKAMKKELKNLDHESI